MAPDAPLGRDAHWAPIAISRSVRDVRESTRFGGADLWPARNMRVK